MIRALLNKLQRRTFNQNSRVLIAPPASAGETVTENNIEWSMAAVTRVIQLISTDVARLPWRIAYRGQGKEVTAKSGSLNHLLNTWPSQRLHSYAWRRHLVRTCLIYGNAIFHISKNGRGEVVGLEEIDPSAVQLQYEQPSQDVYYEVTDRDGTRLKLYPDEVLHFRLPGANDGLWGNGLLSTGREALSLLMVQGQMNSAICGQGVAPRCVIKHPGRLSPELGEQIKTKFEEAFRRRNAGGTVLAMDGMDIQQLRVEIGTDIIPLMTYSIQEVSRLTGVPLTLLGEFSDSGLRSNMQEQNRAYHDTCLVQWTSMIGAEIKHKLLREAEKYVVWDTRELTRGTFADQVAAVSSASMNGIMSRNEAREYLGLNSVEGLDEVLVMPGAKTVTEDFSDEPVY
tara:strand:- start:247 stop:1440 length:1194 start_codon:yes stop_codon:yes gene_type:complete